jgi:hypothetical protein
MGSAITTGPISQQRNEVLAEVAYTHCEEDFVALWVYSWERAGKKRFNPLAYRLGGWVQLSVLRALAIAFALVIAFAIAGEKSTQYILGGTAATLCWVVLVSLTKLFFAGPEGLVHRLARWRYRRQMRWAAREMAARKTEINLSRHHRLRLTMDSCIHLVELHETDQDSMLTERTETVTSWTALDRIEMTDQHAFLFERHWAIILPRRAFLNDSDFQEFVDLAVRLRHAAIHGYAQPFQLRQAEERITS